MSEMNEIQNLTNHIPVILGCDYANGQDQTTTPRKLVDYSFNQYLKDHQNECG